MGDRAGLTPVLSGRRTRLRPVEAEDLPWLMDAYAQSNTPGRYSDDPRALSSVEDFSRLIWERTVAQFVVEDNEQARLGHVQLLEPDVRARAAQISVLISETHVGRGWPFEGVLLFINYVFQTWDLRRIYLQSSSSSFARFSSASRFLVEEGRLLGHHKSGDTRSDLVVYSLHREVWQELNPLLTRFFGPAELRGSVASVQ